MGARTPRISPVGNIIVPAVPSTGALPNAARGMRISSVAKAIRVNPSGAGKASRVCARGLKKLSKYRIVAVRQQIDTFFRGPIQRKH